MKFFATSKTASAPSFRGLSLGLVFRLFATRASQNVNTLHLGQDGRGPACSQQQRFDPRRASEIGNAFVSVDFSEDNSLDSCVRQKLEAIPTRTRSHVDGSAIDARTSSSGLNDCICFRVNCSDAVPILHHAPNLSAVSLSSDTSIVSSGEDDSVSNDDSAHMFSWARGSFTDLLGNLHEVGVPVVSLFALAHHVLDSSNQRDAKYATHASLCSCLGSYEP